MAAANPRLGRLFVSSVFDANAVDVLERSRKAYLRLGQAGPAEKIGKIISTLASRTAGP